MKRTTPQTGAHLRVVIPLVVGSAVAVALAVPLALTHYVAPAAPPNQSDVPSSQSDYPALADIRTVSSFPSTLADQVEWADVIVDATVVQVLPDRVNTYVPEPGSAEEQINQKIGNTAPIIITLGAVQFTTNDVLKGTVSSPFTMTISDLAKGCVPDWQPGDRMLLFLTADTDGTFYSVSLQDAYWYVAKDQKIYPAVVTDKLKEYSGKGLGPFKSEINQIKNALKKK